MKFLSRSVIIKSRLLEDMMTQLEGVGKITDVNVHAFLNKEKDRIITEETQSEKILKLFKEEFDPEKKKFDEHAVLRKLNTAIFNQIDQVCESQEVKTALGSFPITSGNYTNQVMRVTEKVVKEWKEEHADELKKLQESTLRPPVASNSPILGLFNLFYR